MGKKDKDERIYLRKPTVFADICNYALFGGEDVIKPDLLREMDTSQTISIIEKEIKAIDMKSESDNIFNGKVMKSTRNAKEKLGKIKPDKYIDRLRDVFREATIMSDGSTTYVLIGIEAQTSTDRGMVIRVMELDAASYVNQANQIKDLNIASGKIAGSTFISGLLPDDRILPVITLVILFSDEKWHMPRSISELFKEYDPRLKKYIQDYKLNLIIPSEITDFDNFRTDLGAVMKFMKLMNDKDAVKKLLEEDGDKYSNLDYDAARLLGNYANINTKDIKKARTKNGGVNMCKAWEDHGKEEAEKAVAEKVKEWQAEKADLEAKAAILEAKAANLEAENLDFKTKYAKALDEIAQLKQASV